MKEARLAASSPFIFCSLKDFYSEWRLLIATTLNHGGVTLERSLFFYSQPLIFNFSLPHALLFLDHSCLQ